MTSPTTEAEYGEHIVEVSRDRKTIVVNLAGKEYTATKPRKAEEWFVEIQSAVSSEDAGLALVRTDEFLSKILGPDTFKELRTRRLDDDDDLTWNHLSEVLVDIFEVWSTEEDQPVRPTGSRSASGTSTTRKRTTRK